MLAALTALGLAGGRPAPEAAFLAQGLPQATGWYLLAIVAAGGAVAGLLALRFTRSLREIRRAAEAIAAGAPGRKAPLDARGERGALAGAINRMAEETSRRLAALTAESARLEAIVSSMEEGILATDREGRILHCNEAARTLLNIRVDPAGLKVWEAVRIPDLERRLRQVLRDRLPVRTSVEVGPRVIGLYAGPVGATEGTVLVAHDATEQHRYDVMRREFVANVSHELRTPIGLIQGFVETLQGGAWRDEGRGPEFLETIARHVDRLAAIVEDLLQLSRLESTGQIVRPAPLEAREFLGRICDGFRPLAARKDQVLALDLARDPGVFEADPDLLERALGNLLDNAIKYTPERGEVRVRARREGGRVVLAVEDTGPGIPEKDLPRIFERFYRVDKSRSRDLGGTGRGLAIVKHIAHLHGGAATVQSRAGGGCTFTIEIPEIGVDG